MYLRWWHEFDDCTNCDDCNIHAGGDIVGNGVVNLKMFLLMHLLSVETLTLLPTSFNFSLKRPLVGRDELPHHYYLLLYLVLLD